MENLEKSQETQNKEDNKKEENKSQNPIINPQNKEEINENNNIENQKSNHNTNKDSTEKVDTNIENKEINNIHSNESNKEDKIINNNNIITEDNNQNKNKNNNENKIENNNENKIEKDEKTEINNNDNIKKETEEKNKKEENNEKPKNYGNNKMKQIFEEIKAKALSKPPTNENEHESQKEEGKEVEEKKEEEEEKNEINTNTNDSQQENIFVDITEDGGIKKKIIEVGHGDPPSEGKTVFIFFKSKYQDKIFDQSKEDEPFSFTLGENKVIKGWEIALKSMKIGEKAEFIMNPEYTYGDKQVFEWIPANSILNYEIKLIGVHNHNTENCLDNLTYEEKLQWGKLLKKEGVDKFKANDILGAKECFIKALSFLKKMDPEKEEEKEGVDLYLTLLSNICNCYNKEKEYNSVIDIASIGLKIKPLPKLLSYRAIAFAYTEEFDDAKADIENLENILKGSSEAEYNDIAGVIEYVNSIIDERKKIYIEKNNKYSRAIFRQYLYYNKTLKNRPLIPPIEPNPINPIVFFDIKIGENEAKKIEIELFKDVVPITAENFKALCLGTHEGMTYKGTSLNKVIKSFIIGGGELENCTGKDKCVYGEYFDDENYIYGHCRRGLLTMDNDGKNTNNSKFLITLKYIPWFDGKHVVFGQIIKGLDVLKEIENLETDNDDKPITKVIIENCGEILRTEIVKPVEDKKEEIVEKNENKDKNNDEKSKKENVGENKEKETKKNNIENPENKMEQIDNKNEKKETNNDIGNKPEIDVNRKTDITHDEKIIENEINKNKIENSENKVKKEKEIKEEKEVKEFKDAQNVNKIREIENLNIDGKNK